MMLPMRLIRLLPGIGVTILVLLALAAPLSSRAMPAATCESLAALALPHTTIAVAQSVPAGPFAPPAGGSIGAVPAFCRVAGSIKPSGDSDIRFEVWLPATGWNRKLQGIGNGGFAGAIEFGAMGAALSRGYAAAATDTGHAAGALDAVWALGHPEKVTDFGYRAVHETAVTARAIIAAFYGDNPRRAYFSSCSNGGRQALMEAQRYPADYDGIIAGAPANFWTHLLTEAIWDFTTETDPATRVSAAKLPAIEAAMLAACDAGDGVADGVIENPAACRFDPAVLRCKDAETDACLTAPQVTGLTKLLSGPQSSAGTTVFPGHQPGGAIGGGGWSTWVTGGSSAAPSIGARFGLGFFTNMVFERADWDAHTFVVDRDMKAADDKLAATLNSTDPDLSRFAQRGGKLILYHGWSDPAISAVNSIDYFHSVLAKMGAQSAAGFMRLFMVPGMQHCSGGPGPDVFGQGGAAEAGPDRDIAAALESWVEQGTAPNRIVATKYKTGANPASGVLRTRPLCPYPQVARWTGTGSTDDAANFTCAAPTGGPGIAP
jgi:feruloyl esterase